MSWLPLLPGTASALVGPGRQLHHALQLVSGFGLAYVPPQADDSHSNLGWSDLHGALGSRSVTVPAGEISLGLRVGDLSILLMLEDEERGSLSLDSVTMDEAAVAIREWLAAHSLDPARYTLRRHFDIPHHPVADGARFSVGDPSSLGQWHAWLGNTMGVISEAARERGGSEVRLWPHHADMATLITIAPGRTTGAGLAMGDATSAEPYFYVNAHPAPDATALPTTLAGEGQWHTDGWIGAILPAAFLASAPQPQYEQVVRFLDSALDATTRLLTA